MRADFIDHEVTAADCGFESDRARMSVNAANVVRVSGFGGHGNLAHLPGLALLVRQVAERLPTTEVRHGDA